MGYLSNIKPFSLTEDGTVQSQGQLSASDRASQISCLLLYFYTENPDMNGNVLKKCVFKYEPYFYIIVKPDIIEEFQQYISKRFEDKISSTEIIDKVDLDMINHLAGAKKKVLKVNFKNVSNLVNVRGTLKPIVQKNKTKEKVLTYSELLNPSVKVDMLEMIQDLREDDIPYHVRVCIDNEIRCGCWYNVKSSEQGCMLTHLKEKLTKCPLTVLAFDIETTKVPLKFPDPRIDSIMLISYMIDGDGFLITNRSIITEEIEDFQYTPKPEFDGHFHIFNEKDEEGLLKRFVLHCKERRPNIFVTFNGDYFDIPFIAERLKVYGMTLETALGIQNVTTSSKPGEGEYMGRFSVHIDCLYWVKRDAFLPQGSHGLKAVTKAKLGYDPIEVDPEKMLESAQKTPKQFCAYSVSDALATYYLYRLMIHDFIYALCTIIPTYPDEVLRKGSGTLCEELLMAQAYRRNIIFPEKQVGEFEKFFQGHLIDTETYIGGHVECLNVGIYRTDLPTVFSIDPTAYDFLLENVEKYLKFNLQIENKGAGELEDITNLEEVKNDIINRLKAIRDLSLSNPTREVELTPVIYHLDVGAMYPNIILTNKLQPVSMVNDQICAGCIYNKEDSQCKKYMKWNWRGELFPLSRSEYENLKHQYEFELLNSVDDNEIEQLSVDEYRKQFLKRIKTYCSKVYKQVHLKKVELKEGIVCQKENSFYIDTIRNFRDRRYEFKFLVKKWRGKNEEAKAAKDVEAIQNTKNMMDLYESLQLAHKIILNSFYGYVMRKGSRWFSMEMAAMTTHLGSNLITVARQFCERIGKPLELDTDGIWCCLPKGFPEVYKLVLKNGKKINYSFPCTMLNSMIYEKYSNRQYNEIDENGNWRVRTEMSVFFEVDGPYKAMVLPAAKEEGKMLKKRYAVFGFDGRITELKGFELKRRGELKIIKIFQSEVFGQFLKGNDIKECYAACAEIAERWYSILEAEGRGISDEELIDYIEESRMMSKSLDEYGAQKSTSITCAKRLAEILGSELLKDKGLCSKFIISKKPLEAPVAERAVPTVIFQSAPSIRVKLLRKWLNDYTISEDVDMRDVIDWNYYKERLAGNILKIIIIPAAMQKVENPYPNIPYPDWVSRLMMRKTNEQRNLKSFFKQVSNVDRMISITEDLEKLDIKHQVKEEKEDKKNKKSKKKDKTSKIDSFLREKTTIEYEEQNNQMDIIEEEEDKNQPIVNINDNFEGWLNQQKKKWKKLQIQNKKKKTSLLTQNGLMSPTKNNVFTRLNTDKDNAFRSSVLNVLQVIENPNTPGIISLWVTFGNYMELINVHMKRKIYINSLKQNVPDVFHPTKVILPRNKPILNLYEFELEEKDFKDKFNNFNDYIISPVIEGVYETKVPLKFQIIKDYGCFIKFNNKKKINAPLSSFLFNYEDFEPKTINIEQPQTFPHETKKIFLYHSSNNLRHFIALLIFEEKKAYITLVNPVANSELGVGNLKKKIQDTISKEIGDKIEGLDASSISFDFEVITTRETDIKVACKTLNKTLTDLHSSLSSSFTPHIVLLQSCYTIQQLHNLGFTSLLTEFPIMTIPFNKEENDLPALDWARFGAGKLAYRFVDLLSIYEFRNQLSSYCNIPICEFESDPMLYSSDLIFSRVLKASKQALWYSSSGFPDLGGGDMSHDFLGQVECEFPTVCNQGMYLGYVAEVDIGLFCVNAVLESEHMRDMSGKYDLEYVDKDKRTIGESRTREENLKRMEEYKLERDEFVLASNAFIVMKKMVEKWLNDVKLYENMCADYFLTHFYRWISSFNSKFYDPVIYRMINLLMQRYFSILIRKITEAGFQIIYADNRKIILFNNKSNFNDFQTNIEYLFRSIKKIAIFNHIVLTVNTYWKMLMFKDLYNYAGVPASDIDSEEESQVIQMPKIISKWTLSEFLPPILEKDFISLVSDYIIKLYRFFYLKDAEMVSNLKSFYSGKYIEIEKIKEEMKKLDNNINDTTNTNEVLIDFKSFMVNYYISTKMFNILPNILLKRNTMEEDDDNDFLIDDDLIEEENPIEPTENIDNDDTPLFRKEDFEDEDNNDDFDDEGYDDARNYKQIVKSNPQTAKKIDPRRVKASIMMWSYPTKLGSYDLPSRTNLAAEYVNYVCEILFLDKTISKETHLLKRNCLKLISVEEYAKETFFRDPCRTFILRNFICDDCSSSKDIDFCRDNNILSNNWTCENCHSSYDKTMIEYMIIRKVQNIIDYYFNQDLQCKKCGNQKNEFTFTICKCAGNYKKTFDENFLMNYPNMNSIKDFLQTLQDIANHYGFEMLKSLLSTFVM